MPTTVFTATHSLALINGTDSGTQLSWTNTTAISDPHSVVDQNDDTNHDITTDTHGATGTYTGYVVMAGGRSYGVYVTGGNYAISYNDTLHDISGLVPTSGATTTKVDNAKLANCFMQGTKIATPSGEHAIETLAPGEMVTTENGGTAKILWIAQQGVTTLSNLPHFDRRAPVCIKAGALGNHSDLYVSADHGMVVDGFVINASALVNGDTVRFVPASEMPAAFTYHHIETEHHEVIRANGAASETFIDMAGRAAFDNFQEYLDLCGAERIIPEMPLPRIASARLVPQAIQDRLGIPSDQGRMTAT